MEGEGGTEEIQVISVVSFVYTSVEKRTRAAIQAITPKLNKKSTSSRFFSAICRPQIAGMGSTMMTMSQTNISTPWYIVIAKSVSFEKHCDVMIVLSQKARTGLHWKARISSPETVKATIKTMIA